MAAQQNLLGHVSTAVHQAQTQGHAFQAQIIERFNDIQQSVAILSDSLETLSQTMEANHAQLQNSHAQLQNNHQAVNDKVTQLQNGLGTLTDMLRNEAVPTILNHIQPVRDTVKAIITRVNDFDLHIVQPILGAVTHSEEIVMARIGQFQATFANIGGPILQAVGLSENRITEAITSARDQVQNDVGGVRDICDQVKGHTEGAVVPGQTETPLRTALHDGLQEAQDLCEEIISHMKDVAAPGQEAQPMRKALLEEMGGLRNICNRIERHAAGPEAGQADTVPLTTQISTRFREIQAEMRAGHANDAARLFNKFASCCSTQAASFYDTKNKRVKHVPKSYAKISSLKDNGDLDRMLSNFGLSTEATAAQKEQLLRIYLGLKR